eukprot:gene26524-32053_t
MLQTEREKVLSDIYALELERKAIMQTIPKVYQELLKLRDSLVHKEKEMEVYQHAIDEIEKNYGQYLFSPGFFVEDE